MIDHLKLSLLLDMNLLIGGIDAQNKGTCEPGGSLAKGPPKKKRSKRSMQDPGFLPTGPVHASLLNFLLGLGCPLLRTHLMGEVRSHETAHVAGFCR